MKLNEIQSAKLSWCVGHAVSTHAASARARREIERLLADPEVRRRVEEAVVAATHAAVARYALAGFICFLVGANPDDPAIRGLLLDLNADAPSEVERRVFQFLEQHDDGSPCQGRQN